MVSVFYYTLWNPCYIHTCFEGIWKSLPMHPHPKRRGWMQIHLPSLEEFVFTDGNGLWDNPSPGVNYRSPGISTIAVYRGSVLPVISAEPILLSSDLDNTLVGSHPDTIAALRRFNEYWISKHYFGQSKLVYNTGRSLEEYLDLFTQNRYKLLDPDMLITAVGSDAYTLDIKSGKFLNHIDFHHSYDGEFWDSDIMNRLVQAHFKWLVVPDRRYVYPFKIWMTARTEDVQKYRNDLCSYLRNATVEEREGKVIHARAIISGCGDWRYIDITPRIGGKRMGVLYAQKCFKIPQNRTIVAGDSGNDIEMFRDPHYGIIVQNSDSEMDSWLNKKPRENKLKSQHSFADAVVHGIETIFYRGSE